MWADEQGKDKDNEDKPSEDRNPIEVMMDKLKGDGGAAIFSDAKEAGEFLKELGFDMSKMDEIRDEAEKRSNQAMERSYEIASNPDVTAPDLEIELIAVAGAMVMLSHCSQCAEVRTRKLSRGIDGIPVERLRREASHKGVEPNDPDGSASSNEDKDDVSSD